MKLQHITLTTVPDVIYFTNLEAFLEDVNKKKEITVDANIKLLDTTMNKGEFQRLGFTNFKRYDHDFYVIKTPFTYSEFANYVKDLILSNCRAEENLGLAYPHRGSYLRTKKILKELFSEFTDESMRQFQANYINPEFRNYKDEDWQGGNNTRYYRDCNIFWGDLIKDLFSKYGIPFPNTRQAVNKYFTNYTSLDSWAKSLNTLAYNDSEKIILEEHVLDQLERGEPINENDMENLKSCQPTNLNLSILKVRDIRAKMSVVSLILRRANNSSLTASQKALKARHQLYCKLGYNK